MRSGLVTTDIVLRITLKGQIGFKFVQSERCKRRKDEETAEEKKMEKERKIWKSWIASVLYIVMALSLYPQQAAMAEGQDDGGTENTPTHEAEYGNPTWGNWRKDEQTGEWMLPVEFKCINCGDEETEHTQKIEKVIIMPVEIKPFSCTENGERTYIAEVDFNGQKYYNRMLDSEPILARHNYGFSQWDWDLTKEKKNAKAMFKCKKCGHECLKDANVRKSETESEDASCTKSGSTVYIATVEIPEEEGAQFGERLYIDKKSENDEPAKGHNYGKPVWEGWSINDKGEYQSIATFTCANGCGETIQKPVIGKEISRKNPTCKDEGIIYYQVQVKTDIPGETESLLIYEEKIPTVGHSYAISNSAWKWDTEKKTYYAEVAAVCTVCQEKTDLSKLAEKSEKAATCTEAGEITYMVEIQVGDVKYPVTTTVWLPAEGHTYGKPEWRWSKDHETATAVMACTKCEEGEEGHSVEGSAETAGKIVSATCAKAGKATYTASVMLLGKTYEGKEEVVIPAAGHKMKKTAAKAATCKNAGNTEYYTCKECNKYFTNNQGKNEIAKGKWVVKKKEHELESIVSKKPTKTRTGILRRRCKECKTEKERITIPAQELVINIGDSAKKVVKDPKKCKVSLKNATKYKKYFNLDTKKGTVELIKDYSVKFAKSIPLTVKIADKKLIVNVKVKIPAPKVKITKTKISDGYYRYTFKYNIKGADKIQVRCNRDDVIVEVLDRYLSNPKSDGESYVNIRHADNEVLTFTIRAYYGKNVSEKREKSL